MSARANLQDVSVPPGQGVRRVLGLLSRNPPSTLLSECRGGRQLLHLEGFTDETIFEAVKAEFPDVGDSRLKDVIARESKRWSKAELEMGEVKSEDEERQDTLYAAPYTLIIRQILRLD